MARIGFTDYISDAVAQDQVLASGQANKADRRFIGPAIANLGKAVIEGGSELTTEVYESNLFRELSQAKTNAFKELQAYHKKGTAAVRQGRTSVELFNASLLNKVNEIEAKYPGFSEELQKAKTLMGIKPVESLVKEQQRIQVRNETLLLQRARDSGNLVIDPNGNVNFEETLKLQTEFDTNARELALINRQVQAQGLDNPEEYGKIFKANFTKYTTGLTLEFGKVNNFITTEINKVLIQGADPKQLLVGLPNYINQWEANQIGDISRRYHIRTGTKGHEFLANEIKEQAGLLRSMITGSKDPKGLADNLANLEKYRKSISQEQFRKMMPALARAMDVFDDRTVSGVLVKASNIESLFDPESREQLDILKLFLSGGTATKTLSNVQLPDAKNNSEIKATANFSNQIISGILKRDRPSEVSSNDLFATFPAIVRAHNLGLLKPSEYEALRQSFGSPSMQAQIEAQPDRKRKQEMAKFAYDVHNGAVEKHLQQIQGIATFEGLTIDSNGQLKIVENLEGKKAIENIVGTFGNEVIDEANKKLEDYVKTMAYYTAYLDPLISEEKRLAPDRINVIERYIKETLVLKYPNKNTPPAEKYNPLDKLIPEGFNWSNAVNTVMNYIDTVAGRIADIEKRKDPEVEIAKAVRDQIRANYFKQGLPPEDLAREVALMKTPEPPVTDGAALLPGESFTAPAWIKAIENKVGREGLIEFYNQVDMSNLGGEGELTRRELIELNRYLGSDLDPVGFESQPEDDASGVGIGKPVSLTPKTDPTRSDTAGEPGEDQKVGAVYKSPTIQVEELAPVSKVSSKVIDDAATRIQSSLPYPELVQGLKLISKAVQAVETGGTDDPQTATNPKSTATGFFQIISGTRQSAARRLITLLGEDNVPSWVNEAVKPMSKEEHQIFMGTLSEEDQETLFFMNLLETKGSDDLLKRIIDSNFQDEGAIADLYMKIHHTKPSAKLKKRFINAFNSIKDNTEFSDLITKALGKGKSDA